MTRLPTAFGASVVGLPALVAAALAYDAWRWIQLSQRTAWVGSILISRYHLLALNTGEQACAYWQAYGHDMGQRLSGFLEGVSRQQTSGTRISTASA